MTLELTHKIDADGERYQVRKNNSTEKIFWVGEGVDTNVVLEEAKEYYQRLKVPTQETIILQVIL